jgi:hypothetical protein
MFGFIAIKAARVFATLLICITAVLVVLRIAGAIDPRLQSLPQQKTRKKELMSCETRGSAQAAVKAHGEQAGPKREL